MFGTPIRTLNFAMDTEIKAEDTGSKQNNSDTHLKLILEKFKAF